MRGGTHYALFDLQKVHEGHVVVGVSRPDFDPSTGDLPSGASGGGWGYYANGGQLSHGGR